MFLGILLHEIFELRPPYNTRSIEEMNTMVDLKPITFRFKQDQRIKNLIRLILKKNPWERPSCKQILVNSGLTQMMKENGLEHLFLKNKRKMMTRNQYYKLIYFN